MNVHTRTSVIGFISDDSSVSLRRGPLSFQFVLETLESKTKKNISHSACLDSGLRRQTAPLLEELDDNLDLKSRQRGSSKLRRCLQEPDLSLTEWVTLPAVTIRCFS